MKKDPKLYYIFINFIFIITEEVEEIKKLINTPSMKGTVTKNNMFILYLYFITF